MAITIGPGMNFEFVHANDVKFSTRPAGVNSVYRPAPINTISAITLAYAEKVNQ